MNRFKTFVSWLTVFLIVALVIAAIYVTARLAQESFNNYIEPPAIATIRAATPTYQPESVVIRVEKLYTERRQNNDVHWVVTDQDKVYTADTAPWLIFEVGKCYRVRFYYDSWGHIGSIKSSVSSSCEDKE